MRLTALVLSLVLLGCATATAGASREVTVPAPTEWLAVDRGAAFVLDRQARRPEILRVDLATGQHTTVFRTSGFPGDRAWAAGGVLGFDVDVPGAPERTQAIAIATGEPTGPAVTLREAVAGPAPQPCSRLAVAGVTPAGEVVVDTLSGTCGRRDLTDTVSAIGPTGERPLLRQSLGDIDGASFADLSPPADTIAAGPWVLSPTAEGAVRLVDTRTGVARTFRSSLPRARALVHDLQPDGRFVLDELLFRRRGGDVQRVRVVAPTDPARGGRVLETVGTPPRLAALFCGGRLVVSRTKDHRTRIVAGGREIARVSTSFEPPEACDATHLVIETSAPGARTTRLAVIALPAAAG